MSSEGSRTGGTEAIIAAVNEACRVGSWVIISDLWGNEPAALALQQLLNDLAVPPDPNAPPLALTPSSTFDIFARTESGLAESRGVHRRARVFILVPAIRTPVEGVQKGLPLGLLRICIRVVDEMPTGVRAKHFRLLRAVRGLKVSI